MEEETQLEYSSSTPKKLKNDLPASLKKILVKDMEEIEIPKKKRSIKKQAEKALLQEDSLPKKTSTKELKARLAPYTDYLNLSYQKNLPAEEVTLRDYLVLGPYERDNDFHLRCLLTQEISTTLFDLNHQDCVVLGHMLMNKALYGIGYSDEVEEVLRKLLDSRP